VPSRRATRGLLGVAGALVLALLPATLAYGDHARRVASACFAIPDGTANVAIPPGTYVVSSRLAGQTPPAEPHFVPLVCVRPALLRFARRRSARFDLSPYARGIQWQHWRVGEAAGTATFETCASGCSVQGTLRLSGTRHLRTKTGSIALFTRLSTTLKGRPETHLLLSPAPSAVLEDTRVTGADLAALQIAIRDSGAVAESVHIAGLRARRSLFDPRFARFSASPPGLDRFRGLAREIGGLWRVLDLGTDLMCDPTWPDDLLAYCHA
jgi:hypothetical protein